MKILVSDFDNTLYSDIFEYDKNIDAVKQFVLDGNMFIIASSRNLEHLLDDLEGYDVPFSYLICLDGAIIYNKDLDIIYHKDMDSSVVKMIFDILDKDRNIYEVWIDTGVDYTIDCNTSASSIVARPIDFEKACFLLQDILNDFTMIHGYIGEQWMRFYDKSVNKGNAMAFLEKYCHFNHDDIYAIGGSINDVSMLSRYRGYALSSTLSDVRRVCIDVVSSVHELIDIISNEKKN